MKKLLMLLALMMPMMAFAEVIYEDSTLLAKDVMFAAVKQKIESGKNSVVTYSIKTADPTYGEISVNWEKSDCTSWGKHWLGNIKGEVLIQIFPKFFRVTNIDGTVSYRRGNEYENLSAATPEERRTMIADLANIQRIFPDEKPTFNTQELGYTLKIAEQKLSQSPKYLKPKDEEKDKVNPEYTKNYLYFKAYEGMTNDLKLGLKSIVDDVVTTIKNIK